MATESGGNIVQVPRRTLGTIVPRKIEHSKFGKIVLALWPDKPATCLSQIARCSERHANLLIKGERKPNARIAHAVFGEILDD
jgi:hypothetical protein